jgi:signal transduction histidine kinase
MDAIAARTGAVKSGTSLSVRASWAEFWSTPTRVHVYLMVCTLAALSLPFVMRDLGPGPAPRSEWLTAGVLILVSVLNVEISRGLSGGLERSHQPHKALSAWAFSAALLLPTPWLLVVVPVTYAHARWRGLRLPLWKWAGSAVFLVLAGLAAAVARDRFFGDRVNWLEGDGGRGFAAMLGAAVVFLAVETVLFAGSALLNRAEDEIWLRRTLSSASFYTTEAAVLLIGGLLSALWTGGLWYIPLLVPIYALAQRAALHEPLRERAEAAAALAATNRELQAANEFKIDLMGMLGHEIGNPLTAVLGYAQLGAEAVESDDRELVRRSFEVIEANAAKVRTVLHEILNLVSTDRGALLAHPEECLVEPRLRAAASAQPPGRQPVVECAPDLTAYVQPGHLDQMLANLLGNADKYAGGATRLRAALAPAGDTVEVEVTDAGPGVPPEFRGRLFDKYSRSEGTAQDVVGTGLGLFITRELALANHGSVAYRPDADGGSTFVIVLPACAPQPTLPFDPQY